MTAAPWYRRAPAESVVTVSRWSLVVASTLTLLETGLAFASILGGAGVAVPRWEGYEVNATLAIATLAVWAAGTGALAIPVLLPRWGWLCPVGAIAAALLDRQTLAGEIIYLVVVMSTVHWWSAALAGRESTAAVWAAPLRVAQVTISLVFAWATYAKLNSRFMSGAVLSVSFVGPVPAPGFVSDRRVLVLLALITVVAEGFLAVGFWMRGLRRLAVIAAVLFHIFIVLFFTPTLALFAFSFVMGTGYVLFAGEPWRTGRETRAA